MSVLDTSTTPGLEIRMCYSGLDVTCCASVRAPAKILIALEPLIFIPIGSQMSVTSHQLFDMICLCFPTGDGLSFLLQCSQVIIREPSLTDALVCSLCVHQSCNVPVNEPNMLTTDLTVQKQLSKTLTNWFAFVPLTLPDHLTFLFAFIKNV